jgi:hypothetical protein
MKLIPKIQDSEVTPGSIKIYAEKTSLETAQKAVAKAGQLVKVDADTLIDAVTMGKELHKIIGQIETSRKAAKRQFLDANKAIDELAEKLTAPLRHHYGRITAMLANWHAAEERRKAEEDRKQREAEEKAKAEALARAQELERQRQAMIQAAKDAATREALEQASMDLEFLDAEIPVDVGDELQAIEIPAFEPPRAPIPGAVTTKRYRFTLTDPVAAYQYDKYLVRFELSIQQANDIVRMLKDKNLELKIPGVQVEEYTDVTTPSGRP